MSDILRFFHLLFFFPIAYLIARERGGLKSYGLVIFSGWFNNLLTGFFIGFSAFFLLYIIRFFLGNYEFIGVKPAGESLLILLLIIVGFGLGSLINDMIIRGLVFSYFKDRVSIVSLMIIAILLYAIDDIWLEGFSINNTLFSIALGLSFTYAFFTTNSIWANTGIHVGLNVVYGLFFGVSGKIGDGIFLFSINENSHVFITSYLSIIIAFMMFPIVFRLLPRFTSISPKLENENL